MILTTALPAEHAGSRRDRLRAPVTTLATLSTLTVALHLRDPHQHLSWGMCPSAALGFWCPGCGGLRAVNDLGNGHLGAAASSNLLLVALLPLVMIGLVVWTLDRWRGVHRTLSPLARARLVRLAVVVVAAFTVLRNTPAGAWLAP